MFEVCKKFEFQAAHFLTHYKGKCQRLHGHTYTVTVKTRSNKLQTEGSEKNMVVDTKRIKDLIKVHVYNKIDHTLLNDTLETDSPTSELIAKWIFDTLLPHLPMLFSITVESSSTSSVTFFGGTKNSLQSHCV